MGETDNVPKDANYVYRLHKALGNYMQAAGTAHIIAKQDQWGCDIVAPTCDI